MSPPVKGQECSAGPGLGVIHFFKTHPAFYFGPRQTLGQEFMDFDQAFQIGFNLDNAFALLMEFPQHNHLSPTVFRELDVFVGQVGIDFELSGQHGGEIRLRGLLQDDDIMVFHFPAGIGKDFQTMGGEAYGDEGKFGHEKILGGPGT